MMSRLLIVALCLLLQAAGANADPTSADPFNAIPARSIGTARMGGRVTSIAVAPNDTNTIYVGSASGGVWKSLNNGKTWSPIFDGQDASSIGDIAVAPSNPEIVWVGTGEANPRNSVSWGNGVYRSTDGGLTWRHMGLPETGHIGRIVIDPRDSSTVYVAALGHLWGANDERGIFKTRDGGDTWTQIAYLDENTGFIDLALDPRHPDTLYGAAYQCRRDAYAGGNPKVQLGKRAGLYKSTDGGETWLHLTNGLPARPLGRCGIAVFPGDPRILYAGIQSDHTDIRQVPGQEARTPGPAETGGVFRSRDGGLSWTKVNDLCPRPFYFGQIRVDPRNSNRVCVLGIWLHVSEDGGKTFSPDGALGIHADHHALWIDPKNPHHALLGSDGGLSVTYNQGGAWEHFENLPIAQYYAATVDMSRPYRVFGGLQDNGIWGGPAATQHPETDWSRLIGADGFQCRIDPGDGQIIYAQGQYGRLSRINLKTNETKAIKPEPPKGKPAYRFNWNSPLLVSSGPGHPLYCGGNFLFRSLDRGAHWEAVSRDLTRGEPGPSPDSGHTLTAIAQSPLNARLLYAGSDDGQLSRSSDGGETWTDLAPPGMPADGWITCIECSRFDSATVYVSVDRHRLDDRRPYLLKTADRGKTWQSLAVTLPDAQPVHVVREDVRNPDLLFAGTEGGLFGSLDRGLHWQRMHNGLPPVSVRDLIIHQRDRELVIATHGRGLYVIDIAPLQKALHVEKAE
jgi:photosystem II stability/assembly factor-like uncharacterized protein